MSDTNTVYLLLGRAGDIISFLPFFWHEALHGRRHGLCVAKDYAHLLEGLDYLRPVIWDGPHNQPHAAYHHLRRQGHWLEVILAQVETNPDQQRLTGSYQRESWRHARQLENFGRWPLVVNGDQKPWGYRTDRPYILFGGEGISSPFPRAREVKQALIDTFPEIDVFDMSERRLENVYDLIGCYNGALCVVSIDTMHLHLARAARVPFVALINNGWLGSVPPPAAATSFRYSDATPEGVVGAVSRIVRHERPVVWHAVDSYFQELPRYIRAQASWEECYEYQSLERRPPFKPTREINGKPFLKDLLRHAMEPAGPSDVILWANTDVEFDPRIVDFMRKRAVIFGAVSMRRPGPHIGREAFAFTRNWLEQHWAVIPDFVLAAPCFDLVLAAMIRKEQGIISDLENLNWDFYPCDALERFALHEDHPSSWSSDPSSPSYAHNQRLAQEWCKTHMPSLHL